MGSIILILLLFFVLRFVLRYVLPIANAVMAANRKVREMQNGGTSAPPPQQRRSVPKKGDYIDYEEVK